MKNIQLETQHIEKAILTDARIIGRFSNFALNVHFARAFRLKLHDGLTQKNR